MSAALIAEARSFGYNGNQLIGRLVAALEAAEARPTRYRPVVQSGCENCGAMDSHHTRTEAIKAVWAHWLDTGHDPLISDNNGWHRIFLEDET